MKRLCLHEVLVNSEDMDGSGLCPKVVGEEVLDGADKTVDEVKGVAGVLITETQHLSNRSNSTSSSNTSSSWSVCY